MEMKFAGVQCDVVVRSYPNGRTALVLLSAENGMPVAVGTLNLPEVSLEAGEVLIKNYSENEGMLDALVTAGIVEDTGRCARSTFIDAPICRLVHAELQDVA